MKRDILQMTPMRFMEFWNVKGQLPFCLITVRGIAGIFDLDQISSFIWLYLDGSHIVDSIISEICNNFTEAKRDQVEQDVTAHLKRMEADDLIILDYNSLNPFKELTTYEKEKKAERKRFGVRLENNTEKNEILLIVPPSPLVYPRMFIQSLSGQNPLGIGYIASLLRKEGFRVKCLNLYLGLKNLKALEHLVRQNQPVIIGFSSMTENFQNGLLLAKIVKSVNPDSIVVFGGPHVTFLDEEVLSGNTYVDIVVRGEGEFTMLELANYFIYGKGSLDDIRGITYKHKGAVVHTAGRPLMKDLDKLPFPERGILDLDGILSPIRKSQTIITSRGCPGRCKFCAASALAGGKYRVRSMDNLINEITDLKRKNVEMIIFGDDTVSVDLTRFLDLCDVLKNIGIKWSGECRVDVMTKDLALILANSGCKSLQFGVESGSQYLLDQMGKNITINQIKQATKWCTDAGLGVMCTLMIGIPGDTLVTIKQTLDFAETLQREYKVGVIVGCTVPYPGTYYYNHAQKLGISIATKNYNLYSTINPIMDTQQLTRWQVRNLYFDSINLLQRSLPTKYGKSFYEMSKYSLKKDGYRIPPFRSKVTK